MSNTLTGRLGFAGAALAVLAALAACAPSDRAVGPTATPRPITGAASVSGVVVSQVYGGGGNSGATYKNDFIELYNAGTTAVSLSGWSVQYASAAGTSWQVTTLSGSIAPGGYYLVQEAAGTGGTTALPAPDATGSIMMAAASAKVALVSSTTALTGTGCPVAAPVVDFVGYGTANCFEGSAGTPALTNTTAALRKNGGKQDTNDNAADFATGAPTPRNSGVVPPPAAGPVTRVTVTPSATAVNVGATVTLTATGVDSAGSASPTTFTWASSDTTSATVSAAGVVTGVAVAASPVTITATAANGVAGTAAVTVAPAGVTTITRVTFSSSATSFPVGFQTQLFATAFSGPGAGDTVPQRLTARRFESLTPDLAAIDANTGIVTGTGPGRPTLRVTFTPNDGGAPFSATYTGVTIEARVEADSAATYGNNLEFGQPGATGGPNDFLIRRRQFAASYNASRGQPNWVSYEYDARQSGGEDRCNCFTTDPLTVAAGLPAVTTADYTGSGYSRGHMARSADRTTTNVENASTFYLSNIVPQIQDQNAGPWATLENQLGDSTRAGRAVYVAAGPQFNTPGALRYLNNAGKVAIPDSTWKVALVVGRNPDGTPKGLPNVQTWDDLAGVTVIAVMMPNIGTAQGLNADWRAYLRTPDQVEAVTGLDVLNLLQDQYEAALEAGDRPPVPALNGPALGAEGATLAFNAAGTTDPDAGDVLSYAWSFGDGATATGASASHAFADNGSYTVTLTVTDRFGWPSTRTQTVTVANAAPVPTLAPAATTIRVGELFTPQARFTDAGANDATWRGVVAWGDGTSLAAAFTALPNGAIRASHAYAAPGTYVVRFTVTDKDGAAASVERTITVTS